MKPGIWQRLDTLARDLTPFGLAVVLVIIGQVPFHLPGFARVAPLLPLVAVYHWSIHRPDLMTPLAVFLVGLLQDLLSGAPVGIHALVLLTVYGVLVSQRRFFFGKAFPIVWLGFALVGAGAMVQAWVLGSAFHVTPLDPTPFGIQFLTTLCFYPLLAAMFLAWQRAILQAPA